MNQADHDAMHDERRAICEAVANLLAAVGLHMRVGSWLLSDRWLEAVSQATQTMGQLGQACVTEFVSKRWYAGSALLRQVFEAQYLLTTFASEPAAAERWLSASNRQLQRHFAPSDLRRSGGYQDGEYRTHCMLGGHPNPRASWLLPDRAADHEVAALLWPDLAQHLTESWFIILQALERHPARDQVITADAVDVTRQIVGWKERDPLSERLPRPDGPAKTAS